MQPQWLTDGYIVITFLVLFFGTMWSYRALPTVAAWRKPLAWFRAITGAAHLILFGASGLDRLDWVTLPEGSVLIMLELALLLAALHILVASLTERFEAKKLGLPELAKGV